MMEDTKSRLRETAKEEAERQTATAKREIGRAMVEATNEFFPEEVKKRRRQDMARGALIGLTVGILLRDGLRWALRR